MAVEDTAGCMSSDSIMVTFGTEPMLDMGPDTTICGPLSYILNPYPGADSYLWSTGSTASFQIISSPGEYWMEINVGGCLARDTVVIGNSFLSASLGPDTVTCDSSVKLTPEISVEYFSDSLRVTYDATQGVSGLMGAAKVYFHSGYELVPLGAQLPSLGIGGWMMDWGK